MLHEARKLNKIVLSGVFAEFIFCGLKLTKETFFLQEVKS